MGSSPSFSTLLKSPAQFIAVGFGVGLVPKAPGTAGTLLGVPIVLIIQPFPAWLETIVLAFMLIFGCYICKAAVESMSEEDPGIVVWDEITGYCFAMAFVPVSIVTVCLAFVLFRVLDILKPWPISTLERQVSGGIGIMLDDVAAGIITSVAIHVLIQMNLI